MVVHYLDALPSSLLSANAPVSQPRQARRSASMMAPLRSSSFFDAGAPPPSRSRYGIPVDSDPNADQDKFDNDDDPSFHIHASRRSAGFGLSYNRSMVPEDDGMLHRKDQLAILRRNRDRDLDIDGRREGNRLAITSVDHTKRSGGAMFLQSDRPVGRISDQDDQCDCPPGRCTCPDEGCICPPGPGPCSCGAADSCVCHPDDPCTCGALLAPSSRPSASLTPFTPHFSNAIIRRGITRAHDALMKHLIHKANFPAELRSLHLLLNIQVKETVLIEEVDTLQASLVVHCVNPPTRDDLKSCPMSHKWHHLTLDGHVQYVKHIMLVKTFTITIKFVAVRD